MSSIADQPRSHTTTRLPNHPEPTGEHGYYVIGERVYCSREHFAASEDALPELYAEDCIDGGRADLHCAADGCDVQVWCGFYGVDPRG